MRIRGRGLPSSVPLKKLGKRGKKASIVEKWNGAQTPPRCPKRLDARDVKKKTEQHVFGSHKLMEGRNWKINPRKERMGRRGLKNTTLKGVKVGGGNFL